MASSRVEPQREFLELIAQAEGDMQSGTSLVAAYNYGNYYLKIH